MKELENKTAFITGASRGIGLAIGKRLAREGANVVIAAKTAEAHPKLPGTIYTAAEEIEQAGGKALPLVVDIRFEEQVQEAVDKSVEAFGGIDICINNASAISLTPTLQTTMKRYDLMHQVNTRGTFLVSKICIPHLIKSDNPHILNLSPPLNMETKWFAPHVAYTMAKFGMSMCVLGMSDELEPHKLEILVESKIKPIQNCGSVKTENGDIYKGRLIYDLDEAYDFEVLQGKDNDEIEYIIPFRNIANIQPIGYDDSEITLRNGQKLKLEDSQDVSEENTGILVFSDKTKPIYIEWKEVEEVTFN